MYILDTEICSIELYSLPVGWKHTGWLLWFWEFGLALPVPPRRAVAVHPLPSVHLLYVQYIQCQVCIFYMWSLQRGDPAAVQSALQKLIELWFCVLIDTLLYSLHCEMQRLTVLCTAMHHLLTVWMCYEDFADFCGFVYIDTVLHSALCNARLTPHCAALCYEDSAVHMLTLVVLCGGEKVGEEGRWRRTPPLWFTTQLFFFAFLHFFICISCCCTFQNGRGAVHRPNDSQHNTNGKLNINAKQNTDTKHENTPKTQHIHKS